MGYGGDVYREALETVAARREQAERAWEGRQAALYRQIPALEALKTREQSAGVAAVKAALEGEKGRPVLLRLREEAKAIRDERASLLKRAGLPAEEPRPVYTCPLCDDTGYVNGRLCGCVREVARDIMIRRLNAVSPLALSDFSTFRLDLYPETPDSRGRIPRKRMESIRDFCVQYAENFSPKSGNVLFMGQTGLGKTHLSLAIAARAVEKGYGAVYGPAQNFLSVIETEHFRSNDGGNTMESLQNADLLILDDLGAEFTSSFIVSTIYNLINTRLLLQKPTIISTNLTMQELEQRYTERIVSRLCGHYQMKEFLGADVRLKLRRLAK